MKQVILLKGGTAKENYKDYYDYLEKQEINPYEEKNLKWSDKLQNILGENFEVIEIKRPNSHFADYIAWKIIFKKYIPYIKKGAIFIGHSLGGTFFLKYAEENPEIISLFKKIFLVAPACKDSENEVLGTFKPELNFKNLINFQKKIEIFGSKDDFVVPFEEIKILQKHLPKAKYHIFKDKGHFLQEDFKELVDRIKNIEF